MAGFLPNLPKPWKKVKFDAFFKPFGHPAADKREDEGKRNGDAGDEREPKGGLFWVFGVIMEKLLFLRISSTWILFSPEIHIPLNEGHSPRDDSGVVAEEEAAHGGEGDGKVEQDGILAHPGAWPEGEANI